MLNCIWWWDTQSGDLESAEYVYPAITPGLPWPGVEAPLKGTTQDQIDVPKLFVLDRNDWCHITENYLN